MVAGCTRPIQMEDSNSRLGRRLWSSADRDFRANLSSYKNAADLRITLRRLDNTRPFPTCTATESYVGIDGWGASFRFPKVEGVKVSKQGQDIDYGARSYYVETKKGPRGIRHGSGPLWGLGMPFDSDVWRSVKYEETSYDFGRQTIVDARGQWRNGQRWRYLGKLGESAAYSDVDDATSKILDKVMDGACLNSIAIR